MIGIEYIIISITSLYIVWSIYKIINLSSIVKFYRDYTYEVETSKKKRAIRVRDQYGRYQSLKPYVAQSRGKDGRFGALEKTGTVSYDLSNLKALPFQPVINNDDSVKSFDPFFDDILRDIIELGKVPIDKKPKVKEVIN